MTNEPVGPFVQEQERSAFLLAFVQFLSVNRELSKALAGKLFSAGLGFVGFGVLILLFPLVLAVFVAGFCFLAGFALLSGAIRTFFSSRSHPRRDYQDASWREVK